MPRKPPQSYNVCRAGDGALVRCGLLLAVARSECATLNAEARVTNPETGKPTGMYLGAVSVYEVQSLEGILIP